VYQLGRGNDPVMVVGSIFPAVAFSMKESPSMDTSFERYNAGLFQSTKRRRGEFNGPWFVVRGQPDESTV
jgi:hypothetical protein